jgi:tRNA (cmo5U34)-methyltransferase
MSERNDATPWSETDSARFIDLGAYYVPEREVQIETIGAAIPATTERVHLVELCCGEGLLAEALAARFPNALLHAFDGSPTMLEAARQRLAQSGRPLDARAFELADAAWRRFAWPIHAVVSSLAVHHLDAPGKARLYADMAGALAPGGALVICDLVLPSTPEGQSIFARHWDDGVRQRSLELDRDLAKLELFRADGWNHYATPEPDPVDQPSPLFDQLKWLEAAGLDRIEVHWLKAGHAIFSGRKPR